MLDELLFTLEIARQSLPADAHAVHTVRLYLVERMIKRALEVEPDYWRASFDKGETIADTAVTNRRKLEREDLDS
jgi:hypothetical protein